MNAFDSFLLGKTMAESNQALGSMFAGQQAAAARRADQEISDTLKYLSAKSQEHYNDKCRLLAEKKATIALLQSVVKNGGSITEQSWSDFYAAYNSIKNQDPSRFAPNWAKDFADKLYNQLR